jgi:pimeloyl-ACP methyl ester carboxylesterase
VKLLELLRRAPRPPKALLGVGMGAGLVGAVFLGLRYFFRRPDGQRIPDAISPRVFKTRVCQTSGGQIVYHESNPGQASPTLLFLHSIGVGASSYEWSKVYPEFAENHRVLALDWVGFGESERPLRPLSAERQARALADFIQRVCPEGQSVIAIAAGQGAGLLTLMASHHPELLDRIFLIAPSGRPATTRSLRAVSRLPNLNRLLYRYWLARAKAVKTWLERAAFARPGRVTAEMVEVFTASAQQARAELAIYHWLHGGLNVRFEARISEVKQPVTILWPERSPGPLPERVQKLASTNRRVSIRAIEEAGPLAALEVPEQIIAVLEDELRPELHVLDKAG